LRVFKGATKQARVSRGIVTAAWAFGYGPVKLLQAGNECVVEPLPPPLLACAVDEAAAVLVVWLMLVGCDFSGFFVEMLGLVNGFRALNDAVKPARFAVRVNCDENMYGELFGREAFALRALAAPPLQAKSRVTIVHGSDCGGVANVDVARLMVERLYAPGRDAAVYACALRARRVWAPTRWAAEQFAQAGVPRARLRVLPEAVDAELFSPDAVDSASSAAMLQRLLRLGYVRNRETTTFLAVGKWERRKGFEILLEAFFGTFRDGDAQLLVHSQRPSWEAGDPDLGRVLKAAREKYAGAANAIWLGPGGLSRGQLRALYGLADVFVLATRGEGWGLPIHEALLMGLKVVCTNATGPGEWLPFDQDQTFAIETRGVDASTGYSIIHAADVAVAMHAAASAFQAGPRPSSAAYELVSTRFSPSAVAAIALRHVMEDL